MPRKKINPIEFTPLQAEILASVKAGKSVSKGPLFRALMKETLEAALEGELESHLTAQHESAPCSDSGAEDYTGRLSSGRGNRRNGKGSKTVYSDHGPFELLTPRDREGTFDPQAVKKRQTVLTEELDDKILGLYKLGMSYTDIASNIEELYAYEASPATISAVTDKLVPLIAEWRSRPLEEVYPVVFLDAMFFKTRQDNQVKTKVMYNILGINKDGKKEILGFYTAESEGANFWLGVLNDLRERGVKDILIACIDGLKGFPEAIHALFPETEIQLCVVHQIRNSLKYVASRDQKEFMADLKQVYKAPSKDTAEYNLLKLDEKWGKKYPVVLKSWNNNWEHLSNYFKYSAEIRKLIYTTNPIEGFHRQVRKYTKTKGAFTSDNALFKLVFCAIQRINEKWNMPIQNWALTVSQLHIYFGQRMNVSLKLTADTVQ